MLVLIVMLVGGLWLVGATSAAKKVAMYAVALALVWSVASFGLCRLRCLFNLGDDSIGSLVLLVAFAALVLIGFLSWHGRDRQKKRLESFRKKNLHPRARALPLPPLEREP
jgi:hypothetical protein